MPIKELERRAEAVRRFNRFYTRQIGVLHEHLLGSDFSLTQVRILYELAYRTGLTTSELGRELGLNAGYMSRVISGFERQGLVSKTRSPADARVAELALTDTGRAVFDPLDVASRKEVVGMLSGLSDLAQRQLLDAMGQIERLLGASKTASYVLRDPRPGDMGMIVSRQAALYAQEHGWNGEYEALAAEIVAKYLREHDSTAERCWIAEQDSRMVGSVFIVRQDETTAKLRLLYVDPIARGLGIGSRLVDECLRFSRQVGYRRMVLWTNSVLADARRIYERADFRLLEEESHHSFGKDLVGQVWGRDL